MEGNRGTISDFFQSEYAKLVSYVRRWLDATAELDAEDIVQDVMVRVINAADVAAPIRSFSAYVYRSLKNRIMDEYRKTRTQASLEEVLEDIRYDAADELIRSEMKQRLLEAIDELREDEQAVLLATEFEGVPFRELAEEWEIPLGTLLARKSRAVKKLRKILSKWYEPEEVVHGT